MGRKRQQEGQHQLPRRMHLKHGQYYYVTSSTPRKWIPLGKDENKARTQWARLENGEVSTICNAALTMKAVMARYERDVLPTKAKNTSDIQRVQLQSLAAVFGDMIPDNILPTHIGEYLDRRGKKAPVAANREISLLSHVFTKAMRWGFAKSNPCTRVEKNPQKVRERYITDAEYAAVLKVAPFAVQIAMELAYYTGQRLSDVLKMRWSDIQDGCLLVEQQKTKTRLSIEIHGELQTVMDRARTTGKVRSLYLVSNTHAQPYTKDGFTTMFARARAKAGINDFHFHDIRGKSATDMSNMQTHLQEIQSLLGHKTQRQTENYIKSRTSRKAHSLTRIVDTFVDSKKNEPEKNL
jgi:integrase